MTGYTYRVNTQGDCPASWVSDERIRRIISHHQATAGSVTFYVVGNTDLEHGPTHKVESEGDTYVVTVYGEGEQ